MSKTREPLVYIFDERVQSTVDIDTIIDRLRALSVHDLELAKLLDEMEPYLAAAPDPSLRPVTDTQLDLF